MNNLLSELLANPTKSSVLGLTRILALVDNNMNPIKGYEHPKVGELIDGNFLYLNEVAGKETWTRTSLSLSDEIAIEESSASIYCRPILEESEPCVVIANNFNFSFGRIIGIVESKQAGERYIVSCNPGIVFNEKDDIWEDHTASVWYKIIPSKMLD